MRRNDDDDCGIVMILVNTDSVRKKGILNVYFLSDFIRIRPKSLCSSEERLSEI
jgi:hypothetical protein